MNKPNNWYEMDYEQQREWERAARKQDELEYDLRRAQEEADDTRRQAAKQRRALMEDHMNIESDYETTIEAQAGRIAKLRAAAAPFAQLAAWYNDRPDFTDDLETSLELPDGTYITVRECRALIAALQAAQ